jgi:hypothetical protein
MKKLKYIICDLDGTLLNDEKRIAPQQVAYIKDLRERKGIRFGFASGRTLNSLIPLAEENGLADICDVLVGNNGVDIYDVKNQQNTKTQLVSKKDILYLLDLIKPYEFINVIFHNQGKLYGRYKTERLDRIYDLNHYEDRTLHSPYTEDFEPAARVTLIFDEERFQEVEDIVSGFELPPGIKGFRSDHDLYDWIRADVSKANGIKHYVTKFGDTLEQVMAFGDSGNDIEMLQAVGVSVAMKNASEEIRSIADYVTDRTNNESGIMYFLKSVEDWF